MGRWIGGSVSRSNKVFLFIVRDKVRVKEEQIDGCRYSERLNTTSVRVSRSNKVFLFIVRGKVRVKRGTSLGVVNKWNVRCMFDRPPPLPTWRMNSTLEESFEQV